MAWRRGWRWRRRAHQARSWVRRSGRRVRQHHDDGDFQRLHHQRDLETRKRRRIYDRYRQCGDGRQQDSPRYRCDQRHHPVRLGAAAEQAYLFAGRDKQRERYIYGADRRQGEQRRLCHECRICRLVRKFCQHERFREQGHLPLSRGGLDYSVIA